MMFNFQRNRNSSRVMPINLFWTKKRHPKNSI